MTITTHCDPFGPPPPNVCTVPGQNWGTVIPATGPLRGVLTYLHGMVPGTESVYPPQIVDQAGLFPVRALTLCNTIAATGWQVIGPMIPGDGSPIGQAQLLWDDINTDTGHGSRLLGTILETWDHVLWTIRHTISATAPVVPVGFSLGGFNALHIAIHRTADIAGYVAHHPATILSDTNPAFTVVNFGAISTAGCDITASALNAITSVPGLLGWGSTDFAVGASPWTGDTLTPALYSAAHAAGAPVSPNCDGTGTTAAGSPTENHVLTSATDNANPNNDVNQIATWFLANLPHN